MNDKTKPARSCANCQYFGELGVSGVPGSNGECTAPLPVSFRGFLIRRRPMTASGGTDCAAHRMKVVRKPANAVTEGVTQ